MESREESIEKNKILMSVKNSAMLMDPFFKIGAASTVMLVVFLARMVKEHKLKKGDFNNFQDFMKVTDGRYQIVNVPVDQKNGLIWFGKDGFSKELDTLRELGIRFTVMPDLNPENAFQQLAIFDGDKEKFSAWYESYLMSRMQGGEKELLSLKAFTEGRVSIVSVPLEGKENLFEQDFKTLGINYSILPDLHVGDGDIHLMVANTDLDTLQYWYEKYKEDCLTSGEEIKDMKTVNVEDYTKTGEMTEEEYIDTASEELKKANEKYEGKEPGIIEKSVQAQDRQIQDMNNEAYEALHKNPAYQELSINHKTLVGNMSLTDAQRTEFLDKGMFASRIPGTFGDSEEILLVPTEQVFSTNNGQTYLAFVEKNEKPFVLNGRGTPIPVVNRLTGMELFNERYDPVNSKYNSRSKVSIEKAQVIEKAAKGAQLKAPIPPIKIK